MIKNASFVNLNISTNNRSKTINKHYIRSSKKYNLNELSKKKGSDWIPYKKPVGIGLKKNETAAEKNIYAKATDNDNNIHIINNPINFYTPL